MNLLDGGTWWAAIERVPGSDDPTALHYAKVIAWQEINSDEGPSLVAWINGLPPVRSDRWSTTVGTALLNHFTPARPSGSPEFVWA